MEDNDHRSIGNRLGLFHQQEEAPGMIFWHPRGWQIYRIIENYIRAKMKGCGYSEVRTPQLLARSLWEQSGHWEKFGANMYSISDSEDSNRHFCLKPMSCPCHIQLFNKRLRSYRDLPLRYSEFGACHRDEPSGSLQGIMRTKAFTQDDAHVFCTEDQIEAEVIRFCDLLKVVYKDFGFSDFKIAVSTRPEKRVGSDEIWDRAELRLKNAADAAGLNYEILEGEGAFYGPKLEFHLSDARGRYWQCGTVQLDFVLPERLGASFTSDADSREIPVLLHHAVLGGMERFIGILLEHYDGWLPLWLAPEQVLVANINDSSAEYAKYVAEILERAGVRVVLDLSAERIQRKIVDAREQAIPIFAAVGDRDKSAKTVSLRARDGSQQSLSIEDAVKKIKVESLSPLTPGTLC